jgi:MFS family permease
VDAPVVIVSPRRLKTRLGTMFALESASLAAYAPLLSLHAREGLGLTPLELSLVFAVGPLTSLIGPPVAGLLADRWLHAERVLAVGSLLRALALFMAARATGFHELAVAMALHGLFASNTGVVVNTVAFQHLPDARGFGTTRVWGTAGWFLMVNASMLYLDAAGARSAQLAAIHGCFYVASAVACVQAAYALTLPDTPPARGTGGVLAALRAVSLLRSPRFSAALAVAVIYGSLFQANLILQGLFFADPQGLRLSPAAAGRASSVSQLLELFLFPFLGSMLSRLGLRRVVMLGVVAWPLRYAAYFAGGPVWLVVAAQLLHGVSYVLGFAGLQIAVELMAPAGLRASAQAAFIAASSGLGNLVGQLGCGLLLELFATRGGHDWRAVFAAPLLVSCVAVAIAFFGVREPAELGPEQGAA